ncbi:MAG: acetyl-CoA carboxylase biotin carboxyl carrier protein [Lachnospiraceae bacterium]|nr:acetyl-CoA carboxylase biotin carboxyl carrier protein [Lachnospiraceae bacterium]
MNIHDIYELIDRFENSCMSEMQIELDGAKVMCRKGMGGGMETTTVPAVDRSPVDNSEGRKENGNLHKTAENSSAKNTVAGTEIRAKVAGTFYRAPSPESEPFVQVGQTVKKGDTVGMIEAMKMMNDITAPSDGEIVEIIAKNEELVGFDDVLIILKEV